MSNVNLVILIGRLGKDPEIRQAGSSDVCNFSIATTEKWTDKAGEKQEKTEWHNIVAWGRQAELCSEYLEKGLRVYIQGKLQTRKWTDKNDNDRYTTEIVVQQIQFIDFKDKDDDRSRSSRDDRDERRSSGGKSSSRRDDRDEDRSGRDSGKSGKRDDRDDDIPF